MSRTTEIDWEEFRKKVKKASGEAARETNQHLAGEMSSLVTLTQSEVQDIFPEKSDKEDFSELMKIVKSHTSQNQKITAIAENSEKFGKVMISLLSKIM